jgi:SAM-dependent methyltransferase
MYGDNYGYRSGLNASMVRHLTSKAQSLFTVHKLNRDSVVLDIGSNDGTLLNSLTGICNNLYGMDPTSRKFAEFYDESVVRLEDFFNKDTFLAHSKQADLIFSIAMFYDLDDPISFVKDISGCLAPEGIWHFEMSYLPSMIDTNSFDTICHEHVEYYSLSSIEFILTQAGMKVIDLELNEINGGSVAVTAAKIQSNRRPTGLVDWLRESENNRFGNFKGELIRFAERVESQRVQILSLMQTLKVDGKSIWGVGASTKGNVLLQYCGLDSNLIDGIADVNPYKFGRETPGTRIPIMSEEEMLLAKPDYAIVLPWHFKSTIIQRSESFTAQGGKLIFPLPMVTFN